LLCSFENYETTKLAHHLVESLLAIPKAKRKGLTIWGGYGMVTSKQTNKQTPILIYTSLLEKSRDLYSYSLGVGATLGIRSIPVLMSSHRNPPPCTS